MSVLLQSAENSVMLSGMDRDGDSPDTSSSFVRSELTSASTTGTAASSPMPEPHVEAGTRSCEAGLCSLTRASSSEPVLPEAQRRWAARPIPQRLEPFRKARHWMAAHPEAFAKAVSPNLARAEADTLVIELLPLLEAILFLERSALKLLRPRKLGRKHRPLWLSGVQAELHREPLGHILVIGPGNFPLFLPGVQAVQALVAGNAVTWKPGAGAEKVARLFAHVLREAGLPRGILHITDDSVGAAQTALAQHPDKVVFTGSFETGRTLLNTLARTATPSVMELSGADAVVVLPSADLKLAAKAIAFGLRLNGAEVCMSPRRLIATDATLQALRPLLDAELATVPPVRLSSRTVDTLQALLRDAICDGATVRGCPHTYAGGVWTHFPFHEPVRPFLIEGAKPAMAITRTDLFAPVLSLLGAPTTLHLADLVNNNPYALTAAIFGEAREAESLAAQLRVGTVLINDLIAPTADPRVPFGGRGHSGFGVTRGAEGLHEMTATKVVLVRRKGVARHYEPLSSRDLPLFAGLIGALHGGSLHQRWLSLKQFITAARATKTKH